MYLKGLQGFTGRKDNFHLVTMKSKTDTKEFL